MRRRTTVTPAITAWAISFALTGSKRMTNRHLCAAVGLTPRNVGRRLNSIRFASGRMIGSVTPSTSNRLRSSPDWLATRMIPESGKYGSGFDCLSRWRSLKSRAASTNELNVAAGISSFCPDCTLRRWSICLISAIRLNCLVYQRSAFLPRCGSTHQEIPSPEKSPSS